MQTEIIPVESASSISQEEDPLKNEIKEGWNELKKFQDFPKISDRNLD